MTTPNINREHPEYRARSIAWKQWKAFGATAGSRAAALLPLGPVLQVADGICPPKHCFVTSFAQNCDLKGTNLRDFFRRAMLAAFVCGSSPIVVDFAVGSMKQGTSSRAYLVAYGPDELINWSYDKRGKLNWAVLRTSPRLESETTQPREECETRWIRYGRTHFQVYRRVGDGPMELIEEGQHRLARLRQVPLFELRAHHDSHSHTLQQVLSAIIAASRHDPADLRLSSGRVRKVASWAGPAAGQPTITSFSSAR